VSVSVGSRDPDRGQQAVDEIGGRARLLVLDVTDADSIAEAAQQVQALDILVNNAGISLDTASAPDGTDVDTFRRTYETNVRLPMPCGVRTTTCRWWHAAGSGARAVARTPPYRDCHGGPKRGRGSGPRIRIRGVAQ
jgi:NAD(P)-dependent dehydrogenase (short-subunit alcohol dehydrogenase family)